MLRFVLLGTGSSDLYPSPWCGCDFCAHARESDERNWRNFSCALLYPDVLIDCPPDLPHSALKANVELYKVRHLLVTHSHHDHFSTDPLLLRRSVLWAQKTLHKDVLPLPDLPPLTVYGNAKVNERCKSFLKEVGSKYDLRIEVQKLKPFEPVKLDERTKAHPIKAQHCRDEEAFLFVLERDNFAIFYATDTGWLSEETFDYLRQFSIDLVVADATFGLAPSTDEHMNLEQIKELRERLLCEGILKEDGKFVATHFSPHWTPKHNLLTKVLEEQNIIAGYDGLWLVLA
ncbi:MAG: MBL fold metallo-hydrolase [Armatimonadetes bacterium]|nr:MBL fold metallo-hydrolase [Armatimonadota bacterium]MDW8028997.1 MBL fold metallo-hydrolase [Armatimonadota bacterium]